MKLLAPAAVALASVAGAGAQPTSSFVPVRVDRAYEAYPVAGSGYLAWARLRRNGVGFDAFVARGRRRAIRVNRPGTFGIPGGIDGGRLAYVQWNIPGGWALLIRDLRTGKRRVVAFTDNTHCLFQSFDPPSISGNLVLYSSHSFAGSSCVSLYWLSTGRDVVLDRGGAFGPRVTADEVDGRYAVWTRCDRDGCRVHRYDITTRMTTVIPVDAQPSGASVSRSGTVYLVRQRSPYPQCDSSLVRVPPGGAPQELGAPGEHLGIGSTYAVSSHDRTIVYFDDGRCSDPEDADIYAYVDGAG
ncbi:MAG TPA: hypothetical protein VE753_05225 [Gaiellaceae bacterium]|nr:hypothetical protein [Gaiellaceae bacterium]